MTGYIWAMQEFDAILDRSAACDGFKADLRALARAYRTEPTQHIAPVRPTPAVKAFRVLTHLVEQHPDLPIERVTIDGLSGCSDFVGTVTVQAAEETRTYDFAWCCRWRAEQQGWTDHFGFPDQIRAAREFGWRCFERWEQRAAEGAAGRH